MLMRPTQEQILYEELAKELVTEERFSPVTYAAKVLNLPLPEIARVYELPPFRNGQAGTGQ